MIEATAQELPLHSRRKGMVGRSSSAYDESNNRMEGLKVDLIPFRFSPTVENLSWRLPGPKN